MTVEPAATPRGAPADEHPMMRRHGTVFSLAALVGVLALVGYAYGATRWGPLDNVGLLIAGFSVSLVGFSVLAVFGVRARVIAPFVVAALLLPWAAAGAAFVGSAHRVAGALDELMDDSVGVAVDNGSTAMVDDEDDVVEPVPEDEGEIFEAPPEDVSDVVPLGTPVTYSQLMGPGESDAAEWSIVLQSVESELTVLPDSDYSGSGDVIDAVPRNGFEFCVITSEWSNIGEVASWPMPLGSLVVDGEQIFHEGRDLARGFAVMEQRGITSSMDGVAPGEAVEQVDAYEVPAGATPEAVWITRDDPQVLAGTI